MRTLLVVDLPSGSARREVFRPQIGALLGGRQFISRWLCQQVDPGCQPLGTHNDLIFAPGLLSGSYTSSSNRLSVGAKSPLTGGAKEANVGGVLGLHLALNGLGALVLQGRARELSLLIVEGDRCTLQPCPHLQGMGVYETARCLFSAYGRDCALGLIGPAGERCWPIAAIAFTDKEGTPGRFAGRGGLGAVMGSKRIKAIVVRRPGTASPPVDTGDWGSMSKRIAQIVRVNPVTSQFFPVYGTAGTLEMVNAAGGLPTRNFRCGQFELAEQIGGEAVRHAIKTRGGTSGHSCMPGCVVRCSNRYVGPLGEELVSPLEYETIALLGSNLGIGDLDAVADLNRYANDLGADTIELGATIGVALEAGRGEFGRVSDVQRLVSHLARATELGMALGQGALVAGQVLGVERIPVVKNQAIPGYDPRAIKGNGVTYVTSPMGADHTAGNTIGCQVDHADMQGKAELSRQTQVRCALFDALGLCEFISYAFNDDPEPFLRLVQLRLGEPADLLALLREGRETIASETRFNQACGLGPSTNRLPEFMYSEELPPFDHKWDMPAQAFAEFWNEPSF